MAVRGRESLGDRCSYSAAALMESEEACGGIALTSRDALAEAMQADRGPFEPRVTAEPAGAGPVLRRQPLHLMRWSVYEAARASVRDEGVRGGFHLAPCEGG